ncbi:hypothetical protein CC86DRAFT_321494 [Ophiobolus disseminans]|uniref:Microbial-type PARG catalytic domain-containing protein n=1 Tax=Ophiobolus disseminans TaxID=1469910 RepID=A0A6A7A2V0_9PLEO|nr:hypothetical protein CC86DRAFT_321494 [Ophiobolus disseminans]
MQQGSILSFFQKHRPVRPEKSRPEDSQLEDSRAESPRPENSRSETSRPNNSRYENSRQGQPHHSRHSRRGSSNRNRAPDRRRNMDLKTIADETKAELPNILMQIPTFDAMDSSMYNLKDLYLLDASDCPGFTLPDDNADAGRKGARIKVFDMDTFDAAINLAPEYTASVHVSLSQASGKESQDSNLSNDQTMEDASQTQDHDMKDASQDIWASSTTNATPSYTPKPVAVLNLASERSPGGGWQNGALAQEEALCYRSSLYLSLHDTYYRLPSLSAIYSPSVLIIRDAMSRGHTLLVPPKQPANLPVTSVISVAALRHPPLTHDGKHFKSEFQRGETKRKIRLTLRVAAGNGHTKLVLGALGCGVFGNPPKDVAECFLEVLREKEFQGGWWEEVVFAILDNVKGENGGKDGVGNFGQFWRVLDGKVV